MAKTARIGSGPLQRQFKETVLREVKKRFYVSDEGFEHAFVAELKSGFNVLVVCKETVDASTESWLRDQIGDWERSDIQTIKMLLLVVHGGSEASFARITDVFGLDVVLLRALNGYLAGVEKRAIQDEGTVDELPNLPVRYMPADPEDVRKRIRQMGFPTILVTTEGSHDFVVQVGEAGDFGVVLLPPQTDVRGRGVDYQRAMNLEIDRLVARLRKAAMQRLEKIVVIDLTGNRQAFGTFRDDPTVDLIGLAQVERYFRQFKQPPDDETRQGRARRGSTSSVRRRPTVAQIKANAPAIENIVKSLAAQIDAKLEALKDTRGINDPDVIAGRAEEIGEFEALRDKVAALDREVAKLQRPRSSTKPVVKAASEVGKFLGKWVKTSGPKHLDNSLSLGIVYAGASALMLLGVPPIFAAGFAATVVTGKSLAGMYKGH